jgi:hypothetical protein
MDDSRDRGRWCGRLIHGAGAALRASSTLGTGGLGNPVVATAELAGSLIVSLLALAAPLVALALLVIIGLVALGYCVGFSAVAHCHGFLPCADIGAACARVVGRAARPRSSPGTSTCALGALL